MALILYGISGEGSGHAMRSREVIYFLQARGHEVQVLTYGRGWELLHNIFYTIKVPGVHLAYRYNRLLFYRSLCRIIATLPWQAIMICRLYKNYKRRRPDLIICDLEPVSAWVGYLLHLPLISLDNIHRLVFDTRSLTTRQRFARWGAQLIIRLAPRADRYIITTFAPFPRQTAKNNVQWVPPILRSRILILSPIFGEHLLVYDSFHNERLLPLLKQLELPCRVYGYEREAIDGSLSLRKFNEENFLNDLRLCRAVIGTAGFTLITESLSLRKPFFALPVRGQYEQEENAELLRSLGYGDYATLPTRDNLRSFIDALPRYEANLQHHNVEDNATALTALVDAAHSLGVSL